MQKGKAMSHLNQSLLASAAFIRQHTTNEDLPQFVIYFGTFLTERLDKIQTLQFWKLTHDLVSNEIDKARQTLNVPKGN